MTALAKSTLKYITMIDHIGIFLLLLSSVAEIDFCCAIQHPELQILDQDGQNRGTFCPGSTARLKCIFPEEMEAWLWYVNGSEPIEIKLLLKNYQGHSVQHLSEAGYSTVNISQEEPYRANYSCAVLHSSDNILSNFVEVIFQDTPPDGISATCISNSSTYLIVAVSYTNGCRRDTVVEANGAECTFVMKSPMMAVFQCDGLHPNTSYNITAMDSDDHVNSLTCSTANNIEFSSSSDMASASTKEPANSVYLAALVVCLPVMVGAAAVLVLATYCYRRKRKHKMFLPHNGACSTIESELADEQIESTACQNSTELTSDENPPEDRSQPRDGKPEELQGSSSSDSSRDSNSTSSLLTQQQGGNPGSQYAILDFSSTAGTIKPPSPHDNVSYATIEPQHDSV